MKKTALILTAIILALSLVSCSDSAGTASSTISQPAQQSVRQPEGWPENEYTNLLPPVPGKLALADSYELENGFSVMLSNADLTAAKEYSAAIKNAGFSINATESVFEQVNMCMFTGENANGYSVELIYSSGTMAVTVKK